MTGIQLKLAGLAEAFFPPACAACAAIEVSGAAFCPACAAENNRLDLVHCSRCAEPGNHPSSLCERCRVDPPAFLRAFAPFVHEGAVARAIHRFKYEDHPELARPLARLWLDQATTFLRESPGELCAVPLHVNRFRQRRFDQAQLLAVELARATGRAHLSHALTRTRDTLRQVGKTDSAREENVRGAFSASGLVQGRRLLLIDDVFTTGATARAAAEALLESGAMEVRVLTLARAPLLGL